jgi:hypothetical protein
LLINEYVVVCDTAPDVALIVATEVVAVCVLWLEPPPHPPAPTSAIAKNLRPRVRSQPEKVTVVG